MSRDSSSAPRRRRTRRAARDTAAKSDSAVDNVAASAADASESVEIPPHVASRLGGTAEDERLDQSYNRLANWHRWGPYLAERQWGTVREDYSADGNCWTYFPHDHARSRAYRWGEDGLLGICDRECRLCFALALWNERDPFLKERLFGLSGPEGNHGEDVKECYYYVDSTPTHSYMKGLYKYPHEEFPYARLVEENRRRGRGDPEFELTDTGIFAGDRYFDVVAEYAKESPNDILIRITIVNRGPESAVLHLLPTLWYRNTWVWGCAHEGCEIAPRIDVSPEGTLIGRHATLEEFRLAAEAADDGTAFEWLLTNNETNAKRLFGVANTSRYVKDAFHDYVVRGDSAAVNPRRFGTKAAAHYRLVIPAGGTRRVRLRLFAAESAPSATPHAALEAAFGNAFDETFDLRQAEAEAYYTRRLPDTLDPAQRLIARQACAGLLWSKQFYHYVLEDWLKGDADMPPPPRERLHGRNADWQHLYNRDVISMPDKWEYPWYAAWDLAFHMIPLARLDARFAKNQLELLLREWYMHPNGQIPAYEFCLSDVNPPVHAWACWRVYKMSAPRGQRDWRFLSSTFQKLLINFTWWVNRKDVHGRHLFSGGFLGLDNIGVFDRSKPLPTGGVLEQADGTAWMAFYCGTMLSMALELAKYDPAAEDIASKFFEHFVHIADAINTLGDAGLWQEEDGFYYDQIHTDDSSTRLRLRSIVGLIPLLAVEVIERSVIDRLPGFRKRLDWFLRYRGDLARQIAYMETDEQGRSQGRYLLAIPSRKRLARVLKYALDENEFLSLYGVRSLSKVHESKPYQCEVGGEKLTVRYVPGDSDSGLFGGNSNWRGPVWFPINYLLIEALERYHHFYGDSLLVECPTRSGNWMNLKQVARFLCQRLVRLFVQDASGRRPYENCSAGGVDPTDGDLVLFHEYFHGDTGRGLGASHQTGWTALVVRCLEKLATG